LNILFLRSARDTFLIFFIISQVNKYRIIALQSSDVSDQEPLYLGIHDPTDCSQIATSPTSAAADDDDAADHKSDH
jgi:hypothetical protein